MRRLFEIVLGLQILGGAVFFGALFVSALPASTKVPAAIGLAFVSTTVFLTMVNQLATAEFLRAWAGRSPELESPSSNAGTVVESTIVQVQGGLRLRTSGRLGYLLLGMFAFWIFGGWVISRYVA
jgi:hypothetical protein